MLEQLIEWDRELFLALNGAHNNFWDPIMFALTGRWIWVPFYAVLAALIWRLRGWEHALVILVLVVPLITLTDRVSSGYFKPTFERYRPTHQPDLKGRVHTVNDYQGGKYGYLSSHACNTFGLAAYLTLIFGGGGWSWLFLWAAVVSYTRIYLGVHYPGDILSGALLGVVLTYPVYGVYRLASRYWLPPPHRWVLRV